MDDRHKVAVLVSIVVVLFVAAVGVGNGQGVGYIPPPMTSDSTDGFAYGSQIITNSKQISAIAQGQLPAAQESACMCPCPCTPVPPLPPPTATPKPFPTITPQPDSRVRLVYEAHDKLEPYMPSDLKNDWGMTYHPTWLGFIPKQVLKANFMNASRWSDPYTSVSFAGWWDMAYITEQARLQGLANPEPVTIIGEEVNLWSITCPIKEYGGLICRYQSSAYPAEYPSPAVFAHWYHDVAAAVRLGWAQAGVKGTLVGFYFANDDLRVGWCANTWTRTSAYLDAFYAEYQKLGWGWPDIDAVSYAHRPSCTAYREIGSGISRSTTYWTAKRAEMLMRPWLAGKKMWVEATEGTWLGNYSTPEQMCDVAQRLISLKAWADAQDWMGGILWYTTFEPGRDWYPARLYQTQVAGDLSVVGQAFRDGVVPDACK